VAVIGAGASGIAASEKLLAAGFKVVLIEALDRMGGRTAIILTKVVFYTLAKLEFLHESAK